MSTATGAHRFSVRDFDRMGEAGILGEDDRVELIEGEIVEMTPIGARHAACVNRLTRLLVQRLGAKAIVAVQNPVVLGTRSEPQPDVVVLRPRDDFYGSGHPRSHDVLLLIEVADTSQDYDRGVKLPLYATHGVPEVWLVDLVAEGVEIYRNPRGDEYEDVELLHEGQEVRSASLADLSIRVDELLGR